MSHVLAGKDCHQSLIFDVNGLDGIDILLPQCTS